MEYDNGFLVFDAKSDLGEKEVWRLADEMPDAVTGEELVAAAAPPNQYQIRNSRHAEERFGAQGPGALHPWAFLATPEVTHAFRLVYPNLLAASTNTAYLWDVTTGTLVQTFPSLQMAPTGAEPLGEIRCVDMNAEHVVLCGENEVRVVSREGGGALVFGMPGKAGFAKTVLWPDVPPPHTPNGFVNAPLTGRLDASTMSSAGERPWGKFRAGGWA